MKREARSAPRTLYAVILSESNAADKSKDLLLVGCPILATSLFLWLGWDSTKPNLFPIIPSETSTDRKPDAITQ